MLFHLIRSWPEFIGAACLLLVPLPFFFGRGVEVRELGRSWRHVWPKAFSLPWHWIDFFRVAAGTWLLRGAIGLTYSLDEKPPPFLLILAAGLLLTGMVIQTVCCREEEAFFIPFSYVAAVTAVLFPPLLAALTLILAITASFAFQSLAAFLWSLPVCLGPLGYCFFPYWLLLATGAAVSATAAVLPLLFGRHFVLAHRALPVDAEYLRPLR